jgi:hypothetical protein
MRFRNFCLVLIVLISSIDGFAQLPSISFGNSGINSGCAPHAITFKISNISGNAPNTTCQLNFGDGRPVLNFKQVNVPSAVSHTYLSISCEQTFGGIPNSYEAMLTATKK